MVHALVNILVRVMLPHPNMHSPEVLDGLQREWSSLSDGGLCLSSRAAIGPLSRQH